MGVRSTDSPTAANEFRAVVFTNVGSVSCTLDGFPAVSIVVRHGGAQLGAAAVHSHVAERTVLLHPHSDAVADLAIERASVEGSGCSIVTGAGFLIQPPGVSQTFFVRAAGIQTCSQPSITTLLISPVAAAP